MTLVLQKNEVTLTATSKQKITQAPTTQVQCQTSGQWKHKDEFTKTQWENNSTCRTCQTKKQDPWPNIIE